MSRWFFKKMKEENPINVDKDPLFVIISRHLLSIKEFGERCQGYVESKDHLEEFLEDFRIASGVTFVTRDSDSRVVDHLQKGKSFVVFYLLTYYFCYVWTKYENLYIRTSELYLE